MALPLPQDYPVYVGYPPVDAEYPCITYTQDASDNKFVGMLRGSQVYAITAWAETRNEVETATLGIARIFNYEDENIEDVYLDSRVSGFQNGLYYKTSYVRVILKGAYK
jgi:hypothetical protein